MTKQATKIQDFYKEKGLVRHTIILPATYHEKLKARSAAYGVTQGEIVEAMLDETDGTDLSPLADAILARKQTDKLSKSSLVKKMKDLTPEQLAKINAILEATGS